jgi:hypothetical protein
MFGKPYRADARNKNPEKVAGDVAGLFLSLGLL